MFCASRLPEPRGRDDWQLRIRAKNDAAALDHVLANENKGNAPAGYERARSRKFDFPNNRERQLPSRWQSHPTPKKAKWNLKAIVAMNILVGFDTAAQYMVSPESRWGWSFPRRFSETGPYRATAKAAGAGVLE